MSEEKLDFAGRLGIDFVGSLRGCCVKTILDWNPRMNGQKVACRICNSPLKSVRAGDDLLVDATGGVNDFRKTDAPDLIIGGLFFCTEQFPSQRKALDWLDEREVSVPDVVERMGDDAYYVGLETLKEGTARVVRIADGVLAEVGVAATEKDIAAVGGAGQGSGQPLGVTTTSMASGGMVDPSQGPAALRNAQPSGIPSLIKGMTEMQDGHQHEYSLVPYPSTEGWRVKGLVSYNDGHVHMIEGGINEDGSIDIKTNADQAPVGGHAHAHRIVWKPGMEGIMSKAKPTTEGMLSSFKAQLSAAFDKAKGRTPVKV